MSDSLPIILFVLLLLVAGFLAMLFQEGVIRRQCIGDCRLNNWEYIESRYKVYGCDKCFCQTGEKVEQIW